MLNGFTTYSSAPVCSPSMMFFVRIEGRKQDNGYVRGINVILHFLAQFITPHFGHHDVRDNQVGEVLLHDTKR